MNNAIVEDVIESFPRHILPKVQGETDCQTIHSIHKLVRANARSIKTHLGGGALDHLGIIFSIEAYAIVSPSHPWVDSTVPGRGPTEIDRGTAAQLASERHRWEEVFITFRAWNAVEQALKRKL
jgi:hypothetical protein